MHPEALRMMGEGLDRLKVWSAKDRPAVLDVGSYDYNGSYRAMVEDRGWQYTGLDIQPGPNVDVVSADPYLYPFPPNTFDAVISGNTAHNVTRPWLWIAELARVLKPGGLLVIVTVWKHELNEYPADYFRFMPDGLRTLFESTGQLHNYLDSVDMDGNIAGSAFKHG